MIHLLLSTLEMVVLTFVIGFFVAGVIKVIAVWADSMDFYSSHQDVIIHSFSVPPFIFRSSAYNSMPIMYWGVLFYFSVR